MLDAHAIELGYYLQSLIEAGYTVTLNKNDSILEEPGVTVYIERDIDEYSTREDQFSAATMCQALEKAYDYASEGDVE